MGECNPICLNAKKRNEIRKTLYDKIKWNEIRKFIDNSEETEYTVITEVVR